MEAVSLGPLPLGFRFLPTDEELVSHYLRLKINGRDSEVQVIPEVDICRCEPWELPGLSVIKTDDPEWFFFCPLDRKYPKGHRSNRATKAGYWKATGKDRTIRSRTSRRSSIGTKKTLVFHTGRAPKGKRSHWIMHEYRATEKDLDGTKPGQGAFVLCRLFRKPEEKIEISNCDEVEPTGLFPTTSNSSLDSRPSKLVLVQETSISDLQVGTQQDSVGPLLVDKPDNPDSVPIESHCSSYVASDVEDHAELMATEVDSQLEELLKLVHEPTFEPLDSKVFSPLPSQMDMELGPYYADSLSANKFSNPSEVKFQDGNSEEDGSLTDYINEFFNKQDEYSCEESICQNSIVESETINCPHICMLTRDSRSSSDTDIEVVQAQYKPEPEASRYNEHVDSIQLQSARGSYRSLPFYAGEYGRGNMDLLQNDSLGLDGASATDLFDGVSIEELTSKKNPVNNSGRVVGTGIKIRTRPPQNQPSSHNNVTQGTAPRRIRLQRKLSRRSGYCSNGRQLSGSAEDHKEKPVIGAEEATEHITVPDEAQKETSLDASDENREIAQEMDTKLRLRLKHDGVTSRDQKGTSVPETARASCRSGFSSVYIVSVALVTIPLVIFIGVWRCLKS
ncbi:hypothetical protein HHK36_029288 [Tetracentron sinense]|uniref:NAC domain-containing protein n=1 Tax=Tetracentron sinense TaxID=13715 RepID=A0A834YHN9_TETSI|nr:hypothetical protein HHK36_029288 [Tetracentron sinense]